MNYDVTIGIPVYKAVDYIGKTMKSALNQTFNSIEYLIVDDCGEDGSMAIVEKFRVTHPRGASIRILRNDYNQGVGSSRNRIINEANGRYLYFLDSDDQIEQDTISTMMWIMEQYLSDVVYASYEKIDMIHHHTEQHQYPSKRFFSNDEFGKFVFSQYHNFQVSVCNCLMNIDFLRKNDLRFIDAMFWEDMGFTYEMATKAEKVVLLPDITYHYICRPYSLSNYQDRETLHRDEIIKNASTIGYLKWRCYRLREKIYTPGFCYVLQMNSFYVVCHVLKHRNRIIPHILNSELRQMMHPPLGLSYILRFKYKRCRNMLLWLIPHLPIPLFVVLVWLMGKAKKVI